MSLFNNIVEFLADLLVVRYSWCLSYVSGWIAHFRLSL